MLSEPELVIAESELVEYLKMYKYSVEVRSYLSSIIYARCCYNTTTTTTTTSA